LYETKHYYVSGNTAHGFINLLPTNIERIKKIIVLHHDSHAVKTKIFNQIIAHMKGKSELEIIHSPLETENKEGIIMRGESVAVIADQLVHSGIRVTKQIDCGDFINIRYDGMNATLRSEEYTKNAADSFKQALKTHDDLEAIYINEMDFAKADQIAMNVITKLLRSAPHKNQEATVYHRFFGTTTAAGPKNILAEIIKEIPHRVYIKGRAGTGKSFFMKKIAAACEENGLTVERYYCSFDPNSIDMVLVPELDFCMFDSTAPHELYPERDGDTIIDLYEHTVTKGTDEKYAANIRDVTQKYQGFLKEGVRYLKKAEQYQGEIEYQYTGVTDEMIDTITKKVFKHILE